MAIWLAFFSVVEFCLNSMIFPSLPQVGCSVRHTSCFFQSNSRSCNYTGHFLVTVERINKRNILHFPRGGPPEVIIKTPTCEVKEIIAVKSITCAVKKPSSLKKVHAHHDISKLSSLNTRHFLNIKQLLGKRKGTKFT